MSDQINQNMSYRILTESLDVKTGSLIDFTEKKSILIDNLEINYMLQKSEILNLTEFNHLKDLELNKRLKKLQLIKNCYKLLELDEVLIKGSSLIWTINSILRMEENIQFDILSSDGEKTIYIEDIKSIIKLNTKLTNTLQRIKSMSIDRYSGKKKNSEYNQGYLNFVEDTFLSNSTNNITEISSFSENDTFKENDLVEIENEIFGRIFCIITIMDNQLACIKINDKIKEKIKNLLVQILFTDKLHRKQFCGIIVKIECLQKFKHKFSFNEFDRAKYQNSIKFEEEYNSENFVKNDLMKYYSGSIFHYGKVIKSSLINNEKCLELLPIYPAESDAIIIPERNAIKIHKLYLEMKYYQRTILSPCPILEIAEIETKKFQINDIVDFTLGCSLEKLVGTVQWTGKFNNILVAVINLANDLQITEKSLFKMDLNICQNFIGLNFKENCNLYIAPLSCLNRKKHEEFHEVIKHLLQMSEQSSNNALKVAINMRNENILPLLITKIQEPIKLKSYPEMLQLLLRRKQYAIIEILLNKSISSYEIDSILLNIAFELLKLEEINLFKLCVSKCTDNNTKMGDGEIFLTKIIKENLPQNLIVQILKMDLFNLNLANNLNETPLSLFCDKLMTEAIYAIVDSQSFDMSHLQIALNMVLMKHSKDSPLEEKDNIIEIARFLSSKYINSRS